MIRLKLLDKKYLDGIANPDTIFELIDSINELTDKGEFDACQFMPLGSIDGVYLDCDVLDESFLPDYLDLLNIDEYEIVEFY